MKKKTRAKQAQKSKSSNPNSDKLNKGRRGILKTVRNYAIGLSLVGVAGGLWAYNIKGTMHEMDLSRVGQGLPAVVQVHDPNCPTCQALQRETLAALSEFDDGLIEYVVANIKTSDGAAFAARYGVPHVTLLLFDSRGRLQEVLRGPQNKPILVSAFDILIGKQ